MFYSKQNNGFYSREINGGNLPGDAVEITAAWHAELLDGQSSGKVIAADDAGHPILQDPPHTPPAVTQQVTRAQGKAALITAGLWAGVEAYVDSITDATQKALALVALHDTTHWQRASPFLGAAADALGLTSEQLDDLFRQATGIEL